MVRSQQMISFVGYVLIALGIGHTVTGIILFRPALVDLFRDGFANAVLAHRDRRLAFWFLMFSVLLFLLGQFTLYAAATNDMFLLKVIGWYGLGIGAVGATAMPKSPFWIALIVSPILLWSGYFGG